MFNIAKLFDKKNLSFYIFLFLALLVLLFFINMVSNVLEGFGEFNAAAAFEIPPQKKWMFPQTRDTWYRVRRSEMMLFRNLGFGNTNLSVSFLYTCSQGAGNWRNIFRFSNFTDGRDDGAEGRNPGLWVWPNNTNQLHLRFPTDGNGNNGIDTIELPMGVPMLIK